MMSVRHLSLTGSVVLDLNEFGVGQQPPKRRHIYDKTQRRAQNCDILSELEKGIMLCSNTS